MILPRLLLLPCYFARVVEGYARLGHRCRIVQVVVTWKSFGVQKFRMSLLEPAKQFKSCKHCWACPLPPAGKSFKGTGAKGPPHEGPLGGSVTQRRGFQIPDPDHWEVGGYGGVWAAFLAKCWTTVLGITVTATSWRCTSFIACGQTSYALETPRGHRNEANPHTRPRDDSPP